MQANAYLSANGREVNPFQTVIQFEECLDNSDEFIIVSLINA